MILFGKCPACEDKQKRIDEMTVRGCSSCSTLSMQVAWLKETLTAREKELKEVRAKLDKSVDRLLAGSQQAPLTPEPPQVPMDYDAMVQHGLGIFEEVSTGVKDGNPSAAD